ncbi:MAG: hypothetical protein KDC61_00550 [Saprospiraceae bacterium]|nr:hypothetical protein [Saprospiraceae bacterium]
MNTSELYYQCLFSSIQSILLSGRKQDVEDKFSHLISRAEELVTDNKSGNNPEEFVVSIFHGLQNSILSKKKCYPRACMTLTNSFLPNENPTDDLNNLIASFQKDFDALPAELSTKAESLFFLLQRYAVGLPSGYDPTVSLYDFAKIKTAYALCLQRLEEEKKPEGFLLIGGALSGIQTYLYDIISSKASKNLKGRSFYLHLLADSALHLLLQKIGLFRCNVIFASGGGFLILAPNTESAKSAFEEWKTVVLDEVFKKHRGDLFFETGVVEMTADSSIALAWEDLRSNMEQTKASRFARQIITDFERLFNPDTLAIEGVEVNDVITGEIIEGYGWDLEELFTWDGVRLSEKELRDPENDIENPVSEITKLQTELGQVLKRADFWLTDSSGNAAFSKGEENDDKYYQVEIFGVWQCFIESSRWSKVESKINNKCLVRAMEEAPFPTSSADFIRGFELYGGNNFPSLMLLNVLKQEEKEMPKTFSELAGSYDEDRLPRIPKEQGFNKKIHRWQYIEEEPWPESDFKRLAILRMDVDGLGNIFKNKRLSLVQRTTLSRQLDWFFKGYLNEIWRTGFVGDRNEFMYQFREWTQIIYSGGDDLFLVGRWDCLLAFAQKIQIAFKDFTCENEKIGLSGGIVFVTHKFPVMKAAEFCEIAERKAKRHSKAAIQDVDPTGFCKNSFTFFGKPLHWTREFYEVSKLKERLVENIKNGSLPRGILTRIHSFDEMRILQRDNNLAESWRWRMAYDFTRMRDRIKNDEKVRALIESWRNAAITDSSDAGPRKTKYEFIELLRIAARWAEIEERTEREKRKKSSNQEPTSNT